MKNVLILLMVFFTHLTIAQTLELENESLQKALTSKDLSEKKKKNLNQRWSTFLEEFTYTELPFNKLVGDVEFVRVDTFEGVSKKEIFSRIKEWATVNYGSLDTIMIYEDYEVGRMIVKGLGEVRINDISYGFWGSTGSKGKPLRCNYTMTYMVKDNKLKTKYSEFNYQREGALLIGGTEFNPIRVREYDDYSMRSLYPVVLQDKYTWESITVIFNRTTTEVERIQKSLDYYISSTAKEMDF